ncbi:polysaccharide pyruvyl transferase family protein [Mycobacterium sp. Y57]|uniref:polysaccharide pyruvyl transferase family protein n=1 Tax=Mycolicibacterium xanthum TaxID=2796469 RepID=UPI001C84EFDE|nr:polysaccharide pyruvyl transferase family protein [Mycolicibacterium xanthum]MBX7433109.1 polysaccharide pyruvyl transferase family protein [Mycolicibacterium xanthum]
MTATHKAAGSTTADLARTQHRRRSVLFLGTHGQSNVGDELLLDTFLTELGSDNRYSVNSYDPQVTTAQLSDRFDVTVFDTGSDRVGLLRNLWHCDVVVFGGGNILKELYRSVGRWRYATLTMVLGVVSLARLMGKPVLMANVGIGPVESAPGRLLVRAILRLVWLISVRDAGSHRFALSVGCPAHKLRLVPDAVWVREPDWLRSPLDSAGGRNGSPLRVAVNLNKDVDVADEWDQFLDRLVAALSEVAGARDVEFHALPMQCGFKRGTDLEVLQEVFGRLDAPTHIHAPADHQEVAAIVAGCDLVVSERLHAIILSVVMGCPVVALPYDVKVRELAAQLGMEDRSFDVSADLDAGALAAAILRAVNPLESERDRMASVAAAKRHESAAGFAAVRSWVAAPARTWDLLSA